MAACAYHDPGTVIEQSVSVTSNTVVDGVRTVTMVRDLAGKTSDHYTFDPSVSSLPIISASGSGSVYAYHGPKTRSGSTLKMSVMDSPTCVCDGGIKGSINGNPFHKDCLDEPKGDLVQQKNPTCSTLTRAASHAVTTRPFCWTRTRARPRRSWSTT